MSVLASIREPVFPSHLVSVSGAIPVAFTGAEANQL
jgi:hypothetical protein